MTMGIDFNKTYRLKEVIERRVEYQPWWEVDPHISVPVITGDAKPVEGRIVEVRNTFTGVKLILRSTYTDDEFECREEDLELVDET